MLEKNTFGFQKKMKNLEMDDLKASNLRCVKVLCKAVESLESGLELAKVCVSKALLFVCFSKAL